MVMYNKKNESHFNFDLNEMVLIELSIESKIYNMELLKNDIDINNYLHDLEEYNHRIEYWEESIQIYKDLLNKVKSQKEKVYFKEVN